MSVQKIRILVAFMLMAAVITTVAPVYAADKADAGCGCSAGGECKGAASATKEEASAAFKRIAPVFAVTSVQGTDIPGLFEIVYDDVNVVYIYPAANKILWGMGDDKGNLTQDRVAALRATYIKEFLKNPPFDKAVRFGKGKKTVIEFSDAQCPFCRQMVSYFKGKEKDISHYVFMFPLPGHDKSPALSKYVLCSKDKGAAYTEVMGGKKDTGELPQVDDACTQEANNTLAFNQRLANKLGVNGTPAFFIEGERVDGANTARLDELLAKSTTIGRDK